MRKEKLEDIDLYFITDSKLTKKTVLDDVKAAIAGGVKIVQYREKEKPTKEMVEEAQKIKELCGDDVIFLVNDRIDIALAVDADGVHLGNDDMPYETARKLLGEDKIIGLTIHNVEEAVEAERLGADYVGVSPIFATTTKPDAAAVISQIFKGQVKTDKVKDQIKGKNPDEVMALAHYCQEQSNARNPVGLFFTMLKEGTKPPAPAAKTRPDIPPPKGGYQSGTEPLISPRQFVPEEVIAIFQEKGEAEHIVDNKLWKFLDRYHEKHDPKNYYAYRQDLTQEEVANMLAVAEGIKRESIKQ